MAHSTVARGGQIGVAANLVINVHASKRAWGRNDLSQIGRKVDSANFPTLLGEIGVSLRWNASGILWILLCSGLLSGVSIHRIRRESIF